MDKIIFGDNQFFGINHMSEEKARAQAMRFADTQSIIEVIDAAYDTGIRSFMFTTHALVQDLCVHFRANPGRYPGLHLLPGMPYAHKYANAVAEKGVVRALMDASAGNKLSMLATGGSALLRQDLSRLVKVLVDAEMRMFDGLSTPVVFLQNIVSDLMLSLGEVEAFEYFSSHVRERYGAAAGFITMNLPAMRRHLRERVGLDNPVICSSVNPIGYLMSPTREMCEDAIREGGFRCVAMSVLASGAVGVDTAADYLQSIGGVQSILFGASSRANIRASYDRFTKILS